MKFKSPKEVRAERNRRRRDIRRGMKIAFYEANQMLAPLGIYLHAPKAFLGYTVALAEGNRRDATVQDRVAAAMWQVAARRGLLR